MTNVVFLYLFVTMVTKTDQKGTRATVPKVHFSDAAMIANKAVYYAFPQISKGMKME